MSFFILPFLIGYFAWKRRLSLAWSGGLMLFLAVAVVFANVFPLEMGSDTEALTALHLPIALWLVVGIAYVGGRWRSDGGRMNFVRFSGELFIYYVLIALGGGVLTLFTIVLLAFLATMVWTGQGIDVEREVLIGFDLLLLVVVGLVLDATPRGGRWVVGHGGLCLWRNGRVCFERRRKQFHRAGRGRPSALSPDP